jgi:hypothetical protein
MFSYPSRQAEVQSPPRRDKPTKGGGKPRGATLGVATTIDELRVPNGLVWYGHFDPRYLVEFRKKCMLDMLIELFYNLVVFNLDSQRRRIRTRLSMRKSSYQDIA